MILNTRSGTGDTVAHDLSNHRSISSFGIGNKIYAWLQYVSEMWEANVNSRNEDVAMGLPERRRNEILEETKGNRLL